MTRKQCLRERDRQMRALPDDAFDVSAAARVVAEIAERFGRQAMSSVEQAARFDRGAREWGLP